MSNSQKPQRPGATSYKNPLLSASVTGLTFDDFPNKPLLFPAAPPIVQPTVSVPLVMQSGLVTKEPKSLVTVGSSSLDTESLDEINLNSSNESNQTSDVTDLNSNPLLEHSNHGLNSDSIFSQAASSFTSLPAVASNVLSTFSKRITAISNSRENTTAYDIYQQDSNANTSANKSDIQPAFIQTSLQGDLLEAPSPFCTASVSSTLATPIQQDIQKNLPAPEPPKFYTPGDVPTVPSLSSNPPTNVSGQNNFRFSSKKKLYAPIPGLSDQSAKSTTTLDPPVVSSSIPCNTSFGTHTVTNYSPQSEFTTVEDGKLESSLFSKISNFDTTGVLQNITDLVQSATGSLTQANKSDVCEDSTTSVFNQQNDFFVTPPPPTNYFVSTSQEDVQSSLGQIEDQNAQPTDVFSVPKSQKSHLFTPQQSNPTITENCFQEQFKPQIPLFNSSNLPTQINPATIATLPSLGQSSQAKIPPSNLGISQSQSNEPPHPSVAPINTPQVSFFDPLKYLPLHNTTNAKDLTSHSLPSTVNQNLAPPVPPSSGHTSYRLQKGTKHYKSPLTSQETAPIQVTPHQTQLANTHSSQQDFNKPHSGPLFVTPPIGEQVFLKSTPFVEPSSTFSTASLPNQQVGRAPLLVPPPSIVTESLQSAATAENLKSNKTSQNISLHSQSTKPSQSYSFEVPQPIDLTAGEETCASFVPPIKKLKSDESVDKYQNVTAPTNDAAIQSNFVNPEKTLESTKNTSVTDINKPDSKSDLFDNTEVEPILEPIEPVIEENITEIQKDTIDDSIDETLQKLSLRDSTSETEIVKLPPITQVFNLKNPYRRDSPIETATPASTLPTLASFFTPVSSKSSEDLNFFASLPATQSTGSNINFFSATHENKEIDEKKIIATGTPQANINFFTTPIESELTPVEPPTAAHPPVSAFFPKNSGSVPPILKDKNTIIKHLNESFGAEGIPPPIGFENSTQSEAISEAAKPIVEQKISSQTNQPEIISPFSNYFNQVNQQPEIAAKDSLNFFDLFPGQQSIQPQEQLEITAPSSVTINEDQRIQYFFNNPPLKDASHTGDLNYDLVHSGLGIKKLQQRSLTPISNLVEPPSSACSEFSEISNTTFGQKSSSANLSITETTAKSIEEKEASNKSVIEKEDSKTYVKYWDELPEEILKELQMDNILSADKTDTSPVASVSYKPAVNHWFFKRTINDKQIWVPFSHYDSALLETSLTLDDEGKPNVVAVEGGRYDVNISERKKISVYWDSEPIEVRRCSWFYKAIDSNYVPYEEQTAVVLENAFKQATESGVWHKTIVLGMGEHVIFYGPTVIVHFQQQQSSDAWGGSTTARRPRVVKRDLNDFNIEQGESQKVDHLLFMVHGIGSACDLKLRTVEEVVEDFRTIARQLVQSHYKNSTDLGIVGRVEVLPISWHSHLHSVEMGIDEKLRMITLESIPKLRNFTNDTLLDILFYTSPTYCQKIMNTIASSMNTLYLKYRERNPEFNGGVSLAGHSLGSLILFDLLCHQNPIRESDEKNSENTEQCLAQMDTNELEDKQMRYTMGPAGTGQPFINYDQLIFQPKKFFAFGSPIGMFVTIRGIDKLGLDFCLPTCPGFYNIFHPYDPVAYRVEALVNPDLTGIRPVLIPHHKGRKRMHLELKETMTRVSMDLKNRFLDKFKTTLESVNIFASAHKSTKEAEELMEQEVDKVIEMQLQLEHQNDNNRNSNILPSGSNLKIESDNTPQQKTDSISDMMSDDVVELDFPLGKLNDSKRIDYVLQEAPLEFINEYIFALSSHVCYWDSEDTILFVMKEIYSGLGISPDSQVPQQTMTIERPSSLFFMFL